MRRLRPVVFVFALAAIAVIAVYRPWRAAEPDGNRLTAASASEETALQHAKRHLDPAYVCPMHPEITSDQPGKCPLCGMALVPRESGEEGAEAAGSPGYEKTAAAAVISLSPAVINQLGVRTAKVRRGTLERQIETFGNFLSGNWTTNRATRPITGPVTGEDPGAAPVSRTVVIAQVPERKALFLQPGQTAWVRLPGRGAEAWKGTVDSVDPQVNQALRTLQFRVAVEQAVNVKPGMVARVIVAADPIADALLVPRDAVIATSVSNRVVVALGSGRFEPREVVAEDVGQDEVIIRSGLNEGDQVVVSGQFLLDSEASLQAGLRRLTDDRQAAQPASDGGTGK